VNFRATSAHPQECPDSVVTRRNINRLRKQSVDTWDLGRLTFFPICSDKSSRPSNNFDFLTPPSILPAPPPQTNLATQHTVHSHRERTMQPPSPRQYPHRSTPQDIRRTTNSRHRTPTWPPTLTPTSQCHQRIPSNPISGTFAASPAARVAATTRATSRAQPHKSASPIQLEPTKNPSDIFPPSHSHVSRGLFRSRGSRSDSGPSNQLPEPLTEPQIGYHQSVCEL